MIKRIIFTIILIAIVFFLVSKFNNSEKKTENVSDLKNSNNIVATSTNKTDSVSENSNSQEIVVNANNYSFTPNIINAKKGEKIIITLKNVDGFHDFVIDELSVATKKLKTGESEKIEFVADRLGTFEYYCSVGEHRKMGMVGTLIVK